MAIASSNGGARIAATLESSHLLVYEAQMGHGGAAEYLLTADITLPAAPTDVVALPLPAPAFAVGCTGRHASKVEYAHYPLRKNMPLQSC